jgi:hypothetical protein
MGSKQYNKLLPEFKKLKGGGGGGIQTQSKNVFTGTSILYSPRVPIRGSVVCAIQFIILR